jgi:hypothetical protein
VNDSNNKLFVTHYNDIKPYYHQSRTVNLQQKRGVGRPTKQQQPKQQQPKQQQSKQQTSKEQSVYHIATTKTKSPYNLRTKSLNIN